MQEEAKKPVEPIDDKEQKKPAEKATKIDFAKLDLGVEKVEERISPNETNVFDK